MDTSSIASNLWYVGLFVAALTGLCLVLGRTEKPLLTLLSRKLPQATSPKKQKQNSYKDVLPPQRRQALSKIAKGAVLEVDEQEISRHILPMTTDYQTCQDQRYTPTGFSVQEILDLGNFPGYAELSGLPMPQPYHGFDIDKALPRPYRPFRWAYHQTMSISKMDNDWWIELENTYKLRVAQRKDLYSKHGKRVLDYLPGSELACKELLEMVLQYVCTRYPHYSLVDKRIFQNRILETEQDIRSKHPLEILIDNIPEDFGIMLRDDKTGSYIFRAGVICSSIGWSLDEKIGLPLHLVHEPVPDYKEKMQTSMERFFTKLPTDKPIQRGSWGLHVGQPLWMPKGDPREIHQTTQDPNLRLEDCYLRVDWQTLRRLLLSAAVVFNFKAVFTPVTEFRDEPGVPALVARVLKEGKRELVERKETWHVEHVLLPKMEEWEREQRGSGLVPRDWKVATLDESPYFRGWEGKWHRQQGFWSQMMSRFVDEIDICTHSLITI